jgi:pimeloyl-ACP methyl ester carboxylesterase
VRGLPVHIETRTEHDDGAPINLAATLFVPDTATVDPPIAMFCFSGGGMSRAYFDLDGASFAEAMTAAGFLLASFDHAGIGDSQSPQDPFQLTARRLAAMEAQAVRETALRLRSGSLHDDLPAIPNFTMIGVGHSMGAMLVTLQQAAFRPYNALALLGFSTRGLPEMLTPAEQTEAKCAVRGDDYYIRLAKQRFSGQALADIPARREGSAALKAAAAPLLTVSAMQSMLPNNVAAEAASIDVPIFLAVGDKDITGRPEAIAPRFSSAPNARLLVLENTGHHPFIAPSAPVLYAALASWATSLAART